MGKFEGKIVIVTGASSGIGKATAIAFAKEGANVVLTGRNEGRLAKAAEECRSVTGCQTLEIVSDLSEFNALEPVITKTVEKFGGIDVLVNNAGHAVFGLLDSYTQEQYKLVFDTNMRAPLFLCQFALPHLRKTKGCIINVSSSGSLESNMMGSLYSSSKAALDHFIRNLAGELAREGIRVNGVNPGMVDTNLMNVMDIPEGMREMAVQAFLQTQPLGKIQPEDIADGILYLASASKVSGISLAIDGGRLVNSS